MKLPDRIFALGGAGKAISYELLEADWIQEAVLQPRPEPEQLTVTVIDTAKEEKNRDLSRIQEIKNSIDDKKSELRDTEQGRLGDIKIEYLLLTDSIQLYDQNDLIGEEIVPRIASGVGMDPQNWWLQPTFINENLDFATGVVRKRGLGKALYYKAYTEDDNIRTSIDLPSRGRVAVIAGLGGGTGSGILIDLVEDLKNTQRTAEITLFGVLPNDSEGQAESANAHAALSELEYLQLQDESPFKDQILVPIDPTDFGGKEANILQSSDALEEFDKAMVYLLAAYYNMMDMEDPFADKPSYAPFVIGIPQVLRYNVDAIKDAKTIITGILNVKENALEAESDIYDGIDRFLSKYHSVDNTGEVHDSDEKDLETRLRNVKSLLDVELFNQLGYESVSIYREIVTEAEKEADGIAEQLDIIQSSLRAGSDEVKTGDEQYIDGIDQQLGDVISTELNHLSRRIQLIKRVRSIKSNRIKSTLSYLLVLSKEEVNPGVRLTQLESKTEEVAERHDRLQRELDTTKQELDELKKEQQQTIERKVEAWTRDVEELYNELQRFQTFNIESGVESIEAEMSAFAQQVQTAETLQEVEGADATGVRQQLTELSADLEQFDMDFTDSETRITSSLKDLIEVKKSFLRMTQDAGLIEKYSPFTTSGEQEREQAEKDYRITRNELNDAGVFNVSRAGEALSIEIEFNGHEFIRTTEEEIEARRKDIIDAAKQRIDGEASWIADQLERDIEYAATFEELRQTVEEAFETSLSDISELAESKREIEQKLESTEATLELHEGAVQLFEELNNRTETFSESQEQYINERNEYDETGEVTVTSEAKEYRYLKKIKPNNVLQLRADSTINQSTLLEEPAERQRLRGSLEELAKNAHSPKYNGLRKRRISSDRTRYNDMNIVVGVMSQAVGQMTDEANLQPVFSGAFDLGPGNEDYASYPVQAGGNWDVGLGIFIGGVFLDNIRAEAEPDGYYSGYQARDRSSDQDIMIHHTYGLDQGYYVRRDTVQNLENPDDVNFFLRSEPDIVEDILTECVDKVSLKTDDSATNEDSRSSSDN